ncbi:aspartate/glutamate racemase family protein [Candidatus Uhrbacteria bacterium]|nr:aspartate/glutamate racemase family protein [Candidatus Uhrbacteria bacterium]
MIGIFDSGIGGLGVASQIRKKAPRADLVYFGDFANMPYGPRKTEELLELTLHAMKFLKSQGATQFVAACNCLSVAVIAPLADLFEIPKTRVIEMVAPTVRAVCKRTRGKILIAATLATVRSGIYELAFTQHGLSAESIALPKLAEAIERQASGSELEEIISPAVQKAIDIHAKLLVFGCTQFPFARSVFSHMFEERGYEIELFDPSDVVADEAVKTFNVEGEGLNTFFVSKSSCVFNQTVFDLFGSDSIIREIVID